MPNTFVNNKGKEVQGDAVFQSAKEEPAIDEKGEVVKNVTVKRSTLTDGKNCLLGVCCHPKLEKTNPTVKITLLCDNNLELIEIDKNKLIDACAKNRGLEEGSGVRWLQAHHHHMVELNHSFEQKLEAIGDTTGLYFYFKNH